MSVNGVFWHILRHRSKSGPGPCVSLYFIFMHIPLGLFVES